MPDVACQQWNVMLERGRGDQRIGCWNPVISLQGSTALGDRSIQRNLLQLGEQPAEHLRIIASREQLAASDDRVSKPSRGKIAYPSYVIDDYVRVDQHRPIALSHSRDPNRCDLDRGSPVRCQTTHRARAASPHDAPLRLRGRESQGIRPTLSE